MSHSDKTELNMADLNWFAFQYVSDGLSSEEAREFELRLAEDQAAREAVAEAVLLWQAVAAGAKVAACANVERRSWRSPAAWAAIGAAACLALIFVLRTPLSTLRQAQLPQEANLTSAELALVWVQGLAPEALLFEEDDLGLAADIREVEADEVVPHWMLEALGDSQESLESKESS
jgi:hypothetical protein